MEDLLKQILLKLDSMEKQTREGFEEVNQRFDKVDTRLVGIEQSVNSIQHAQPKDIEAMLGILNMKLDMLTHHKKIKIKKKKS